MAGCIVRKLVRKPASGATRCTVGIVVPTLGQRMDWLRQSILSITEQEFSGKVVVAVVGSDPATQQELSDLDVEFIMETTPGLSGAINTGWDHLRNRVDYWSWLGDDDLLSPQAIQLAADALSFTPRASFVYGRTRVIDESGRTLHRTLPTAIAPYYARFGKDYIPQPGSLLRVTALEALDHVLDDSLHNAMDLDLFLRLSAVGWHSWRYIPKELSAYRVHTGSITSRKGSNDESEAVRRRYQSKPLRRAARLTRVPRRLLERLWDKILWTWPSIGHDGAQSMTVMR